MAAKTQTATPASRLSRIGLALGFNSSLGEKERDADDWYIPYHGPYETRSPSSPIPDWNGESTLRKRSLSFVSVSPTTHCKNGSVATLPRSTYDQAGGVGDTPIPQRKNTITKRTSLASFLSFGPPSRKRSSTHVVQIQNENYRSSSMYSRPSVSSPHHPLTHSDSSSYLSTERPQPAKRANTLQATSSTSHQKSPESSMSRHPYATAYPTCQLPIPNAKSKAKDHVTFTGTKAVPAHLKPSSRASLLKASASSPDLRSLSKGKHHWLSAETWCDAIIFPRPRFTVRHVDDDGKERIISPPPTPLLSGLSLKRDRQKSISKSKSVTDLRTSNFATVVPSRVVHGEPSRSNNLRPQSFAFDDLAIPSPVPSLAAVLADGKILQDEREAWKRQAKGSIGNKRSRSLSRTRSKSQSQSTRPWVMNPDEGAFDFLAARTLLGNQARAPAVNIDSRALSSSRGQTSTGGFGTFSSSSATQSRSRSKSHGHSSSMGTVSESHGHKRNGSFGVALRKARTTAAAVFAPSEEQHDPKQRGVSELEVALNGGDTRMMQLSEWTGVSRPQGPSPTPSGLGEGVGIAISTPPPEDRSYEDLRMPAHPYAQGFAYSYAQSDQKARPTPEITTNMHRQPVTHPYAPHGGHLTPEAHTASPSKRMFAQIPSGHIREILADEIQYSPFVVNGPRLPSPVTNMPSNRNSATWNMGEALNSTMRSNRGSPDSGIGASEDQSHSHHPFGPALEPSQPTLQRSATSPRPVNPPKLAYPDDPSTLFPLPGRKTKDRPHIIAKSSDQTNHTLQSSASESVNPFGGALAPPGAPLRMLSDSTGSSAGRSHESSPPLSIRPMERLDDYESFHDLFYRPSPATPASEAPPKLEEAADVDRLSRSRTISGLTSLARQLGDDMSELNDEDIGHIGHDGEDDMVMWGRRRDSFKSERPSDSQHSSVGHKFRPSLRLPEPIQEHDRSEASSLSGHVVEEDSPVDDDLRMGSISAVTTPSPMRSPHRASTSAYITLFDESENERVNSSSSFGLHFSPLSTGLTRSSYMTNITDNSRISGLSDFPRPPSDSTPEHASIIASYFGSTPQLSQETETATEYPFDAASAVGGVPLLRSQPSGERVPSFRNTFGGDQAL